MKKKKASGFDIFALTIGVCILVFAADLMLNRGLKDKHDFMSNLLKFVLLSVGIALVIVPIRALMSSKAKQRLYAESSGEAILESGRAIREEYSNAKEAVRDTVNAISVGARSTMDRAAKIKKAMKKL